jgi:Bardet-Biedl syndrome 1 protein
MALRRSVRAALIRISATLSLTCMGCVQMSSLILGTESKQLLFLDPTCSSIEAAFALPAVPTHIAVHGLLAVEYRVNVACRDGAIYAIKDKQLMSTKIECESLPFGIVRTESELYVATIDNKLHSFHVKGKKNWTIPLPSAVTAMAKLTLTRTEATSCCAIALEGGEVRVYNGKSCVASLTAPDTITGA